MKKMIQLHLYNNHSNRNSIKNLYIFPLFFLFFSCSGNNNDLPKLGEVLSFELEDLNEFSFTYGELIGPQSFFPKVTLYYFTNNET